MKKVNKEVKMATVFSKIIAGEIPCYKIYEDDKTFAFLDNNPVGYGHTLVIPKIEVDKLYDLPDDYLVAVARTVQKVAKNMERVLGQRVLMKVMGLDVPHAHVHLFMFDPNFDPEKKFPKPTPEEYLELQKKLEIRD